MMEIRCVISPASRKRFMLPSRGARAGAPWEARGQGQVRSLRATTGESSRRPPALTRSARAPHQRIRLCSWRRPALRSSAWCGLLVSSKSPVVRSERSSGSMAFVLVLIALNLAKPLGPKGRPFYFPARGNLLYLWRYVLKSPLWCKASVETRRHEVHFGIQRPRKTALELNSVLTSAGPPGRRQRHTYKRLPHSSSAIMSARLNSSSCTATPSRPSQASVDCTAASSPTTGATLANPCARPRARRRRWRACMSEKHRLSCGAPHYMSKAQTPFGVPHHVSKSQTPMHSARHN